VGRCVGPTAHPCPSLHHPNTDARTVGPAHGHHIVMTSCVMRLTVSVRAPAEEQVGSTGATLVKAAFERLGWGVAVNPEHDLGTDLFVMARDERRFDLGQVVGVQVKAGRRYFRYHSRSGGAVVGWWFRDDDRAHIDAWLSHALPHLIVLHDPFSEQSYWAHVTQDAVLSTGKGAKIFIPTENTIDTAHRDALLQVAATARTGISLEGSLWTGAASLLPKDRLRHALVVPRLIAPHPNTGFDIPVNPVQAVALLTEARLPAFQYFATKHTDVPALAEAVQSSDWGWRLVGALGHRLTTGEPDQLQALLDQDTLDGPERAALTVIVAAELMEAGRVDEAVPLLEDELGRDEAEPVDYAWLRLQHARACVEVGRLDNAREDAAFVQRLRITHPDDITATAIAGVAAMIVFTTTPWAERNVSSVVQGADTAVAWWRTQTIAGALSSFADRTFEAWSHDATIHLGGGDQVNDQLLGAALTANYLGDHGAWRQLYALLGQDRLVRLDRNSDPADARAGLDRLRMAGDDKAIELAVRQLAVDGPAMAITLAAADVDLNQSTHTTGKADLLLMQHGGDLLDPATAERTVGWLLATLRGPSAFLPRTTPSYLVALQLIDTLAGVVPAAPLEVQEAVIQFLVELPAQSDQAHATSWARVAGALPPDSWGKEAIKRLASRSDDHWPLQMVIYELAARYDPDIRAALLAEAEAGSLDALGALHKTDGLSEDAITRLIEQLSEQVTQQVSEAHAGCYGGGGPDVGRTLVILNAWHPEQANWEPIFTLLPDPAVAPDHKQGALQALAAMASRLSEDVRARVAPIARSLAESSPSAIPALFGSHHSISGVAAHLAVVLGAYDEEGTSEQLLKLLAGTSDERLWVVGIAGRARTPEHIGLLVGLCQAPEPDIRANAGATLASIVAGGNGGALALAGLRRSLADPGTRVPQLIAKTLAEAPSLAPAAQDALAQLRDHPSALVRSTASRSASGAL
jgi:Domain of unknown function (DUF4365)